MARGAGSGVLREKGLPSTLDHAESLERHLEQHGSDEPVARQSLTDNVFLRSSTSARVMLGIPLRVD